MYYQDPTQTTRYKYRHMYDKTVAFASTNRKKCAIIFALCVAFGMFVCHVLHKDNLRRRNFWKDGSNVGKVITTEESRILALVEKDIVNFLGNLNEDEKSELKKMQSKCEERVSDDGFIKYKQEYDRNKLQKKLVKKMFKRRAKFTKSLSSSEGKILKSAIKKLTFEDKLRIAKGCFIIF